MSLQVTATDDGELHQLHATGEVLLPELQVEIVRALANHARHLLVDLRHAWIDADRMETTLFVGFLRMVLLPKLSECDGRTVFLMHTINPDKEPESYQFFQDLRNIDETNSRLDLVSEIKNALHLFTQKVVPASLEVKKPELAYA